MLILTRKVGETVIVGDHVSVTVLGVKGNQVRVGINAPKDVSVHRKEIYAKIHQDDEAAAITKIQEVKAPSAFPQKSEAKEEA